MSKLIKLITSKAEERGMLLVVYKNEPTGWRCCLHKGVERPTHYDKCSNEGSLGFVYQDKRIRNGMYERGLKRILSWLHWEQPKKVYYKPYNLTSTELYPEIGHMLRNRYSRGI